MHHKHHSSRIIIILSALLSAAALTACDGDDGGSGGSGGTGGSGGSGASGGAGGSGGSGMEVMTIAAARALPAGQTATVEGFVTVAPGTFNSATGDQGFAIQDDTGGVYVGLSDLLTFPLDQRVRVTGALSQVAQQTVLAATGADVTVIDGMTQAVAPAAVNTGDVNESVEGTLVQVSGNVTQAVMDDSPYGMKVFIDDGSGEIQVFVHLAGGAPIIDTASVMMNQQITVVGLGGQYEATYEVMPRKADDLTP